MLNAARRTTPLAGRPTATGLGAQERFLAIAAAAGIAVAAVVVAATGAPVAWLLLAVTGATAAAVAVRAILQRRYFEPLTIVAAVTLVSFALRPLQLFLSVDDLLSWYPPQTQDDAVLSLAQSETAQFVAQRLPGELGPALTRTMAAVTVFFLLFVAGYALPVGRGLRARIARVGTRAPAFDARRAVVACLVIGLVAQVVAVALAGGPAEVFETQIRTTVLEAGSPLLMHFLLGFSTVGLVIWAVWVRPSSRRAKVAFALVTVEILLFWSLAGTRTRALLPLLMLAIVSHHLWRPWARRTVVAGLVAVVVLGSALLSVRQESYDKSFGSALLDAPQYIVDPNGVLNDFTEFDILFWATSLVPEERGYADGQGLVDAFASYVPSAILPDKPAATNQEFGKLVWGHDHWGGRPYTIVGGLYYDFGFPGIAVGAVLFGILGRLLLSLLRAPPGLPGRQYRIAVYAIAAAIFYLALATDYAVAIGFVIEYALPFLLAVYVIGRWASRRPAPASQPSDQMGEPVAVAARVAR